MSAVDDPPHRGFSGNTLMRGPFWGMGKGIALLSCVIALGVFFFVYPLEVLTLTKNGQILFAKRVSPGDTFQLAFLHSIALSEVRDFFLVDSKYQVVLTETRFQGQGTGLPSNFAPGEQIHREGDWFEITGMHRVVPSISWRVQAQWQNRFRFGNDSELNLSSRIGDALVLIQIQKMNMASYYWDAFLKSKNL